MTPAWKNYINCDHGALVFFFSTSSFFFSCALEPFLNKYTETVFAANCVMFQLNPNQSHKCQRLVLLLGVQLGASAALPYTTQRLITVSTKASIDCRVCSK